jgi:hypothetical protein
MNKYQTKHRSEEVQGRIMDQSGKLVGDKKSEKPEITAKPAGAGGQNRMTFSDAYEVIRQSNLTQQPSNIDH